MNDTRERDLRRAEVFRNLLKAGSGASENEKSQAKARLAELHMKYGAQVGGFDTVHESEAPRGRKSGFHYHPPPGTPQYNSGSVNEGFRDFRDWFRRKYSGFKDVPDDVFEGGRNPFREPRADTETEEQRKERVRAQEQRERFARNRREAQLRAEKLRQQRALIESIMFWTVDGKLGTMHDADYPWSQEQQDYLKRPPRPVDLVSWEERSLIAHAFAAAMVPHGLTDAERYWVQQCFPAMSPSVPLLALKWLENKLRHAEDMRPLHGMIMEILRRSTG